MPRFRGKFARKGPLPFRYVLLLSFVFFLFSTALGFWMINKAIEPTLMSYAESQTRKIAAIAISRAISEKTVNQNAINAIEIESGKDGKPPVAKLNPDVINRIFADTTMQIQKNLTTVEEGDIKTLEKLSGVKMEANSDKGISWGIPLGRATSNALFGNLGPKIPVQFFAIGDVRPDVKTTFKPMGINNTWIGVSLHFVVSVQIILPFATKITEITENVPVGGTLIQGQVPQFFNSGGGYVPSVQIPDKKQ